MQSVADRDALVLAHLNFVDRIVHTFMRKLPSWYEKENVRSCALVGLVEAAQAYEPQLNVPFECYAQIRIRGAIINDLRLHDPETRCLRIWQRSVRTCEQFGLQLWHRPLRGEEIAALMDMPWEEYCVRALRLERARTPTQDEPEDVTPAPERPLDEQVNDRQCNARLARAMARLTPRQQLLLTLRYQQGLGNGDIGAVLDLAATYVSQKRNEAERTLRAYYDADTPIPSEPSRDLPTKGADEGARARAEGARDAPRTDGAGVAPVFLSPRSPAYAVALAAAKKVPVVAKPSRVRCTLTAQAVHAIRLRYRADADPDLARYAREYHLSPRHMHALLVGRRWKRVPDALPLFGPKYAAVA